jgi:endonuclease YncB( thermonuclease family)
MRIARGLARSGSRLFMFFPFVLALFLSLGTAAAEPLTGRAHVVDGATLDIAGVMIRLAGVDAPARTEICTRPVGAGPQALPWLAAAPYPCGYERAQALEKLLGNRTVTCTPRGRDARNRVVATCSAGDIPDIGAALAGVDARSEDHAADPMPEAVGAGEQKPPTRHADQRFYR